MIPEARLVSVPGFGLAIVVEGSTPTPQITLQGPGARMLRKTARIQDRSISFRVGVDPSRAMPTSWGSHDGMKSAAQHPEAGRACGAVVVGLPSAPTHGQQREVLQRLRQEQAMDPVVLDASAEVQHVQERFR